MPGGAGPRRRGRTAVNANAAAAVLALALCVFGIGVVRARAGQQVSPAALLPADGEAPGWARQGELQGYEGEDLYTYINGGAEIYQEYGFRRVVVQDYGNASGRSISFEIFEMEDPAAAFGMFTFKRSGRGRRLDLGGGGELESYYLNFWKGRFLATLTGFDESAGTVEGLVALAGAVDAKIEEVGRAPELVDVLPSEDLLAGSVKYLRGLLGLNNVYPFPTARGLAFRDAARGLYESGETILILEYGTAEARGAAWIELRSGLEGSEGFERPTDYLADAVVFKDAKGRYLAFGQAGSRLVVGIHASLSWALATVARVR